MPGALDAPDLDDRARAASEQRPARVVPGSGRRHGARLHQGGLQRPDDPGALPRDRRRRSSATPTLEGLWHLGAEPIAKHDLLLHAARRRSGSRSRSSRTTASSIDRSLDSSRFRDRHRAGRRRVDRDGGRARRRRRPRTPHLRRALLDGKRVVVTGGTGSLGQVLVRRLLEGELGRARRRSSSSPAARRCSTRCGSPSSTAASRPTRSSTTRSATSGCTSASATSATTPPSSRCCGTPTSSSTPPR